MNYIILAAGTGSRLHPFTKNYPKSMLKIGNKQTVAQRMIKIIKKYDPSAKITLVLGFQHRELKETVTGCDFIVNPFYQFTNSIASLWFARDLLNDNTTIINGDIVISEKIMEIVVKLKEKAVILLDSSIKNGDYNVQVKNEHVVVMSKELSEYYGEYAGITKLDKDSALLLKNEILNQIENENYNEWYENALVQMILNSDFKLSYFDISDYDWTEIDTVNDLLSARDIQNKENHL